MKNIALNLVRNDENLERTKSTLYILTNHEHHLIHLLQGNWHQKKKNKEEIRSYMGFLLDRGVVLRGEDKKGKKLNTLVSSFALGY
jgi:NAD(P)H-hydrate repair Nnr-like enzyme with NAD(P)H-hydrate dehydratase domain